MFDFMKNELFFKLGELIDNNIIKNETSVICFGLNHYCRLTISFLLGAGVEKEKISIIDNYREGEFREIIVYKPEEKLIPYNKNVIILLGTGHNKEIIKQLKEMGYGNTQVFETINVSSKLYKFGSKIRICYPNIYNRMLGGSGYRIYKLQHKNICQLTELNKKFKNIHKGERCFILGNGPSLKDVNFTDLKEEYVFAVNQIMSVSGWEQLNINYWVCIDGDLLGLLNNSNYSFYKEIHKFKDKDIVGFVPVESRYYCKNHKLEDYLDLNYVNWKEQYINLDQQVSLTHVDMEKFMMQPYNVVIASINIAIYMGFEEIYLLGCNQSIIKEEICHYLGEQNENMHAIENSEDISAGITLERLQSKGIFFEIKTQLVQLLQFKMLYQYCKKNKIKLVNLSIPTLIQDIPCMKLEEILKKYDRRIR